MNIKFLPTAPGLRIGAAVLTYAGGTVTVPLSGMSDAPMATLSPGAASVLSTGGATLSLPFQIALDGSGNMYVGNYGEENVLKVPAGGGTGTVVNTGSLTLNFVTGVAVDGAGNLYIGDHINNRIVEVPATGSPAVLSISGVSSLNEPTALAMDGAGNLYISDWQNGRIVKVTPSGVGSVLKTGSYTISVAGDTGVAVDQLGTVYIADRTNNRIVKVTAAGVASLVVPTGITPALSNPQGVGVDGMGNVYIADSNNNRIVEVTTAGAASVVMLPGLTSPTTISAPFGVTVTPQGNLIIPDWNNARLVAVNLVTGNLAYATTTLGLTSSDSPKTATMTNVGDEPLIFTASTYPTDFVVKSTDTNLCNAGLMLAAGSVCDVAAKFIPQSRGALSESVTLTDNALNVAGATQQVMLTGTGVRVDTTAVASTATPATVTLSQTTTLTALVTDSTVTSTVPTGSVTFSDAVGSTMTSLNGGTGVALDGTGKATLANVTLSGAGTHTVTMNYPGVSGTFQTSNNTATVTVNKAATTITGPSTQPVMITHGQAGSISVTLAGFTGLATPSGAVAYTITDATNISVASGNATLVTGSTTSSAAIPIANTLSSGLYTVAVSYAGDTNYGAPTALSIALQVGQITPVVTFASPAAITYGTALGGILSATATYNSASVAGSSTYTATPAGGAASTITGASVLSAGAYTLIATFTPTDSTTYTTATAQVSLTINKATPSLALVSSAATIAAQNSIVFTATLSSTASTPTGTVSFYDGTNTTPLSTSTVAASVATLTTSGLTVGSHSITAIYSGNANFATQTSSATAVQVTQDTPIVRFPTPAAITYGTALAGSLGATASYNSTSVPGSIAYTATPVAGSASTVTGATVLGAGTYTLTALFTPTDTATYAAASAQAQLTVNKATPTIVLSSSTAPFVVQNPVSLTAAVSPGSTATGTVSFYDGTSTTPLGTVSLAAGTAVLMTSGLAVGSHSITAVYSGNANFSTQTSSAVALQVTQAIPLVSFPAPAAITYGTALAGSLGATASYNSTSVVGTIVYTATPAAGSVSAVTGSTLLGAGTYTLTALFTPTDTVTYAAASAQTQLTVNKATVSIALVSSAATVLAQNSIVFTATLSSTAGIPTGTVSFYDGTSTTPLGTSTLVASVATLTASGLTVGSHSITAVYSGSVNFATQTSSTAAIQVTQAIPVVLFPAPAAIIYGTALAGSLGATASYNSTSVAGSLVYTATPAAGSASTVTGSTVLGAGTYTLTALFTPTDTVTYATASAQAQLVVNKATPTIVLNSSTATLLVQNPVTLTATVSPGSTATGTVSFYDGTSTTPLGMAPLAAGTAVLTTSELAVVSHSITAIYSGNANFVTLTSSAVTEAVQDFSIALSSGSGGTPSATVTPGGTATYVLSLSPNGTSTFPAAVLLTATGLPPGATYTFTPSSLAVGAGATNVTLAIQVAEQTAAIRHDLYFGRGLASVAFALLLLPFSRRMRNAARKIGHGSPLLLLLAAMGIMAMLTGCGTNTGFFAQAAQTYTVTITGSSGALAHSTNVTLTVQ